MKNSANSNPLEPKSVQGAGDDSDYWFNADFADLQRRLAGLSIEYYGATRNYLDGDVTRLSPFLTHGILNTTDLMHAALARNRAQSAEKFLFQLGWREFFHRVWQARGDEIFSSIRGEQSIVDTRLPQAILQADTGIDVVDKAIKKLYCNGYMHNHERLWVASLIANIAGTSWQTGARWMFYHLLDGDLAANSLSWQWVAGTFSNKRYLANQDNINRYSKTEQTGTLLDRGYPELSDIEPETYFSQRIDLPWEQTNTEPWPESTLSSKPAPGELVLLYHPFNLDPRWRADVDVDVGVSADKSARRILLIEPSRLGRLAMSPKRWQFVCHWAEQIVGLQIYVGEIDDLFDQSIDRYRIVYREYPLYADWPGQADNREWMAPDASGDWRSFFQFWKQASKQIPMEIDKS